MTTSMTIALVLFLLLCSAFFSSAEIVFATSNKHRLRSKAEAGDKRAQLAQRIDDNYTKAISTILVGNNLVNIATTTALTVLCVNYLFAGSRYARTYAELISTLALLIFGEILPKILAADHCNSLVLLFATPLRLSMSLFAPIVWLVTAFVDKLSVLWTPKQAEPTMTDEELVMVVDTIQDEGVLTESEGELIKSAIEFSEVTAHEILIPRVDVVAFNIEDPISELLRDLDTMSFSRIPVYRENIDHIIGILNTKQLMKAVLTASDEASIQIEDFLYEPLFVHMTKSVFEILKEFRQRETNMAIVLDEYGGTMGILTIEDILEEIVGEIYDETDEEETDFSEVGNDTYCLDGDINIYDAFDLIEYEPRDFESEYTTLSGWITEVLDRFPQKGDSFTFEAMTVTVLSTDGPLVDKVEVHVMR